jgi:flavin-binding protein dodecin
VRCCGFCAGAQGGLSFGPGAQDKGFLAFAEQWSLHMTDHVYRVIEVVGSSETSIEDAIQSAVTKASATIRHIRWFEVVETRGQVENGKVHYFQVTMKIGFSIEDEHVHLQP